MIKEGIQGENTKNKVGSAEKNTGIIEADKEKPEINNAKSNGNIDNVTPRKNAKELDPRPNNLAKSPSDTTLYAPVLKMISEGKQEQDVLIDRISNFVESIRMEDREARRMTTPDGRRQYPQTMRLVISRPEQHETREADRDRTDRIILEAEKFRSTVEPPKGKELDDDDFFHLTCHIDSNMKVKIEKGEFVELERLLPKRNFYREDRRLEWVSKDGMTFLAPAQDKDLRITNVKKWNQAFRVYAAIYCNANPNRAGEVWQYIHTIHSAASTYIWENVAYYDHTFRQLMAERPGRSWAKNYAQMWQLALRDTINKTSGNWGGSHNHGGGGGAGPSNHGTPGGGKKHKDWRDNCCWRFNKIGKCDRAGCRFDNRCSYCGIWNSQGQNTCKKKVEAGNKLQH